MFFSAIDEGVVLTLAEPQDIAAHLAEGLAGVEDPWAVQLAALATMQVATMDLTEATSSDCVGFRDYWPEWRPDTGYR